MKSLVCQTKFRIVAVSFDTIGMQNRATNPVDSDTAKPDTSRGVVR